ncbi:MAG: hypothetical protein GX792_10950, partial [Bacteroidales bacterium]|nr:hypothetical protein [Bacteroidales bacterium]
RSEADGLVINPTPVNTYFAEIDEFSKAILENRQPENNYETGLASQKIIDACYRSAKSGQVINIKY